nr:hypothetical protein [uncultured Flavobacterium sp.]
MEKSTKHSKLNKSSSLHSEICVAHNIDFSYRKAYQGDWGHWDDLPDTDTSGQNCTESDDSTNCIGQSEASDENSYL